MRKFREGAATPLTAWLVVVLLLALAACGRDSPSAEQSASKGPAAKPPAGASPSGAPGGGPPPALPVTVQRLVPQRVPIVLDAVGQAEGSREVEIRARVTGILEKRVYAEGAPVNAGALLFRIDRAPYEIAVAQARAALAQEVARAELAQRETERLKTLVQNRAISQRELEEAQSTLTQSNAAIQGAKARLAEAELNLSYTDVKSPIRGITGRALRSEGSLVTANTDSSLLTTLTQMDPVWIRFALAESDYERVRGAARKTQVKLLNQDDTVAAENGRLNFTATTVDPKLGTVQLRAEFPNPGSRWLPGQFVRVQILAGEQNAFLVPQAAVLQTEQTRNVWLVGPENKVEMRPIKTAGWIGPNWVVTSGLREGETVIVDNLMKIRPGATVQPREAAAPAQPPAAPAAASGARSG